MLVDGRVLGVEPGLADAPVSNETTPFGETTYEATGEPLNSKANGIVCGLLHEEEPDPRITAQPFEPPGLGNSPSCIIPPGLPGEVLRLYTY
jgi:hypothetical protein